MPLYEYRCANCHETCEMLQKVSDDPPTACPNCGKEYLQRQISAPRFQLKGTGWYETDFKNKNKPAQTAENAAAKSEDKPASPETPAALKTSTEKDS